MKEMIEAVQPAYRLAVLASHPIQYQTPLWRALAARPEIDLTVFFCSDWGLNAYHDAGFGCEVKWDISLLEDYRSEFLPNLSPSPDVSIFWGFINPQIVRRLRTGRFDAVLVHGWARLTNWIAMLTAFASGIPVLLRGESNLLPALPRWKAALKRQVLTQLFKRVSAFLAIGRYNAEFYEAYGTPKEKIFMAPYAVDNEFFLSEADELGPRKAELKRTLGIVDLPLILYSGKLVAAKRPMDLLLAYAEVSKSLQAALVYLGDGALRPDLEEYVKQMNLSHVYFVGFQNQTEISRFFAVADLFVLPSGFEPWGLVVNEAMCFRLPVIVTDKVGAGGDLVREGVNGFKYSAGNVSTLVEILKQLLTDEAQRQQMGEASRRIIERWSYSEDIEGILSCLQSVHRQIQHTVVE